MRKPFKTLTPTQRRWLAPGRSLLKTFLPETYIRWQYRFVTGHSLNLKHPKRYTEKLQYLRLYTYPKNPLVIRCTDRVGLRDYMSELKLSRYVVPLYGVFNRFEDIDVSSIPIPFVLKATHGSGMNYFVKKKSDIDAVLLKKKTQQWLRTDYGKKTLEPHYSKITPRLIVEPYLGTEDSFPIEYKLHVFHGQAKFLYVVTGRGRDIRYSLYDVDWKPFDGAQFNGWRSADHPIEKPSRFQEMITLAETLGRPFPFVRVDLYQVDDKIYVSEMTFTPAKGTLYLQDDAYDLMIGTWFNVQ